MGSGGAPVRPRIVSAFGERAAGDLARARVLLDLLDVESRVAPIACLAARKSPRLR